MNHKNHNSPPRFANWLLTCLAPSERLEELEGDLLEMFSHWVKAEGLRVARRRYYWTVLRLLRPFDRRRPAFCRQAGVNAGLINSSAWRSINRNRLYTFINILSLSLGICGCIVIWLVGKYEFSFDRFHPDSERIYRLGSTKLDFTDVEVPPPAPAVIRSELAGVENVAAFYTYYAGDVRVPETGKASGPFSLDDPTNPPMSTAIITSAEWFAIFHYDWIAGSPSTSLSNPFCVVLTEKRARQYFGDVPLDKIIGRQLIYEDSLFVHVTGVVRGWEEHTDMPYTDFVSWSTIPASFLKNRRHLDGWDLRHGYFLWPRAFVKLAPGTDTANVDAQLKKLAARHIPPGPFGAFDMHLQPLGDIHFNPAYAHDQLHKAHLPTLYAIMGIAGFILLLAIINFVNLSTAQSLQRAKEIGIRKVLGSGRTSIILQFLLESAFLTTIAVLLAVLLVRPVLHFFSEYIPANLSVNFFEPTSLLFFLGVILVTTVMAGAYPARVLASYKPVVTLKGGAVQRGGEQWWLRKGLIVFQFSLSLVFIIVVLVMNDQIGFMLHTDYGLNKDAVVSVYANTREEGGVARLKVMADDFRQLPGVREVVLQSGPPIVGGGGTSAIYKGKTEMQFPVKVFGCDREFLPFYRLRLVAGGNFHTGDSLNGFIINEAMARQLGFRDADKAIGKPVSLFMSEQPQPIVGVVADFYTGSLHDVIKPVVLAYLPEAVQCLGIRLATDKGISGIPGTLAAMEKIHKKLFPGDDFEPRFMDEYIAALYEQEQKTAALVKASMGIAIFISCMGLLGLSLFMTERRAREIGIRKLLGATVTHIIVRFAREFAGLVFLALGIASPVAWWFAHRWLQDYAYRIRVPVELFVVAGVLAVAIAMVTVGYQTIRAAIANPIKQLRSE